MNVHKRICGVRYSMCLRGLNSSFIIYFLGRCLVPQEGRIKIKILMLKFCVRIFQIRIYDDLV